MDEPAGLSLERDSNHGWVLLAAATAECQNLGAALELSCGELLSLSVLGCVCVTPAAGGRRGTGAMGQGCH